MDERKTQFKTYYNKYSKSGKNREVPKSYKIH